MESQSTYSHFSLPLLGAAGHCLQPPHSHRPTHDGAQEDMALQRHAVLERQLGVQAATHRPRGRQAGLPVPLGRPQDSPRVHWRQHLALPAQRKGPAGRSHVCQAHWRSDQQPAGLGGRNYGAVPARLRENAVETWDTAPSNFRMYSYNDLDTCTFIMQ